eukprot:gnl/MRDRNA2_/MRDRNA2_99216_c0_seq1.p1 gnl/MRDRNA2_/MRDRNA2_99216_c0~~gnl/MRDRNA2_/MRDRNA2_99216_c0_seq1.p1  ORF type:complete len:1129 (+),score=298.57 gnl/MRDRNA2_/MRDRNA2_99216_c0_seq1:119-3388(+)
MDGLAESVQHNNSSADNESKALLKAEIKANARIKKGLVDEIERLQSDSCGLHATGTEALLPFAGHKQVRAGDLGTLTKHFKDSQSSVRKGDLGMLEKSDSDDVRARGTHALLLMAEDNKLQDKSPTMFEKQFNDTKSSVHKRGMGTLEKQAKDTQCMESRMHELEKAMLRERQERERACTKIEDHWRELLKEEKQVRVQEMARCEKTVLSEVHALGKMRKQLQSNESLSSLTDKLVGETNARQTDLVQLNSQLEEVRYALHVTAASVQGSEKASKERMASIEQSVETLADRMQQNAANAKAIKVEAIEKVAKERMASIEQSVQTLADDMQYMAAHVKATTVEGSEKAVNERMASIEQSVQILAARTQQALDNEANTRLEELQREKTAIQQTVQILADRMQQARSTEANVFFAANVHRRGAETASVEQSAKNVQILTDRMQKAIDTETNTRLEEIGRLEKMLVTEVNTRLEETRRLETMVSEETNQRAKGDAYLEGKCEELEQQVQDLQKRIAAMCEVINAEVLRAKASESCLLIRTHDLSEEMQRVSSALESEISVDMNRLSSSLDVEVKRAIDAENDITNALQGEIMRAADADDNLKVVCENLSRALKENFENGTKRFGVVEDDMRQLADTFDHEVKRLCAALGNETMITKAQSNCLIVKTQDLQDEINRIGRAVTDEFKQMGATLNVTKAQSNCLVVKTHDLQDEIVRVGRAVDDEVRQMGATLDGQVKRLCNALDAEIANVKARNNCLVVKADDLEAEMVCIAQALDGKVNGSLLEMQRELQDVRAQLDGKVNDSVCKLEADLQGVRGQIEGDTTQAASQVKKELQQVLINLEGGINKSVSDLDKRLDAVQASLQGEIKDSIKKIDKDVGLMHIELDKQTEYRLSAEQKATSERDALCKFLNQEVNDRKNSQEKLMAMVATSLKQETNDRKDAEAKILADLRKGQEVSAQEQRRLAELLRREAAVRSQSDEELLQEERILAQGLKQEAGLREASDAKLHEVLKREVSLRTSADEKLSHDQDETGRWIVEQVMGRLEREERRREQADQELHEGLKKEAALRHQNEDQIFAAQRTIAKRQWLNDHPNI